MSDPRSTYTIVSFHAHPDDEALLTAGTLARAAAEGHRVVLVVATDGAAGLSASGTAAGGLGGIRRDELDASAMALGAARVEVLGHRDSGSQPGERAPGAGPAFSELDPEQVAVELVSILLAEDADVLTIYDPAGGYGHPDHVQVNRVGLIAARAAGTPVVLEATLDRATVSHAVTVMRWLSCVLPVPRLPDMSAAYTAGADLTHRVDVRAHLPAKRRSLRAHASQAQGGGSTRTVALLLRLPWPVGRWVLGTEWFREVGRAPGGRLIDDIFATLRTDDQRVD